MNVVTRASRPWARARCPCYRSLQADLPNPPLHPPVRPEVDRPSTRIPNRPIVVADIAGDALGLRVGLGEIQDPDVIVVPLVVFIDAAIRREGDSPAEAIPACVAVVKFGGIREIGCAGSPIAHF